MQEKEQEQEQKMEQEQEQEQEQVYNIYNKLKCKPFITADTEAMQGLDTWPLR